LEGVVRIPTGLVTLVIFVLAVAVACTHGTTGRSGAPAAATTAGDDAMRTPDTTATGW
jgi:hypothetical protein